MEASSQGRPEREGAWRALAVLLFAVLAFGCAVIIVSMVDISRTPTCHEVRVNDATPHDGQCFSGSSLQKTISLALGFPSGLIAGVAGVLAVLFAITGRRGGLALALAVAAILLGALSILVGSV